MNIKILNRLLSFTLALIMCVCTIPAGVVFADSDRINVGNDYIEVTEKKDGSAFGINTIKGIPSKRFDDNKPLLYDGDDKFATSYTTVRIVKNPSGANEEIHDYIYGSSSGQMTVEPYEYRLDSERTAISSTWAVEGVEITQQLIINQNTASAHGGYANVKYTYKNTNSDAVGIGIRVLLDTKIAESDGGQFYTDGGTKPITKETEFTEENKNIPEMYSISDSVTYSTTTAYGLLKSAEMKRTPDKVQFAHWFNLANTMWDYTVNGSVNFDDYYNEYNYPDSAVSIMFNPEHINSGDSGEVDTMYGVGELNGMESTSDFCVMTVTQKDRLKANSDGTGYENNGEVTLYVTVDNSDKDSKQIVDGKIKLVFEDKEVDTELNMTQEPALWVASENEEDETVSIGTIDRGAIKRNIPIKLKARPVYVKNKDNKDADAPKVVYEPTEGYTLYKTIDTRKVTLQLTGDGTPIPSVATKVVTLPSLGGEEVDLGFTGIDPKKIYYQGYSYFSVQGMGSNFKTLTDKSNWTAYLTNAVTGKVIDIDSFNCSVDTENKQLGLLVDMGGRIGSYKLTIEFKNALAELGKREFSDSEDYIESTADEKYKNRGYSIISIARTTGGKTYEMRMFSAEDDPSKSIEERFESYKEDIEKNDGEMLIEGRGVFKVLYKDGKDAKNANKDKGFVISTDQGINNFDIMGFETIAGSDNIKLNRIMYYNSMTPLSFKAEFDENGVPNVMKVEGDGDLSIINASTIWKHRFMIRMVLSDIYAYSDDDEGGLSNTTAPQLQLLGGGWLLQNMGGFIFNLNYGELGCQDGRYTINFSGSVSFPLGMSKDEGDGTENGGAENTGGETAATEAPQETRWRAANPSRGHPWQSARPTGQSEQQTQTSTQTPTQTQTTNGQSGGLFKEGNSATNSLGKFGDGGSLGVSVDSILFGEHEDRNEEGKFITGFVGIAANVEIELPDSVFPAGGSQNNDSRLSSGAAASNPTDPNSTMVSARNPRATTIAGQRQNAANARSRNKGKLNGFEMGVSFNTYEFNAAVDLGIGIGPISSAFRMSLAETNNGKICLDSIYLEIKGFSVPIVPGVSSLIGLGGGISDLASSINYKGDARPPVTVSVMAAFDLVKVMVMQADMSVSGNGLSFSITGAPKGFDQIKFVAKGDFDWTTGFSMRLSGTVDMFSGIVLGNVTLALTTDPEFFMMGKISGSLNIPGLGKLAGVTLVITNKYIAGGVKIFIFSGGFVYYYDTNKFRLMKGSEIDEIDEIDLDNTEMSSSSGSGGTGGTGGSGGSGGGLSPTTGYASKMTTSFLEVKEVTDENGRVQLMGIGSGAKVVGTTVDSVVSSSYRVPKLLTGGGNDNFTVDISDEMMNGNDVVLRVYYDGEKPTNFTVKKPDNSKYNVVEYDENLTQEENNTNGANLMFSEKEENGVTKKYAYINLSNADLVKGNWTVTADKPISDHTVLTVPTVTPMLNINSADISNDKLSVNYTADSDARVSIALVPCDDNCEPIKETLTDENGKAVRGEDGKDVVNDHPGYIVANEKGSGNKTGISLEGVPSGDYIVRVDSILNNSMFKSEYGKDKLTYINPKTLAAPTNLEVWAGGDGRLDVKADVPDNATGIQFNVYRKTDSGEELLPAIGGYVAADGQERKVQTYFKGENTVIDENGAPKYSSAIIPGETYRVKAYAVNMQEGSGYFTSAAAVSGDIRVPVPTPPTAKVTVTSTGARQQTDDKNISYLQASGSNVLIEYEITNFGTDPSDPNSEVTVRFDIDEKQYGTKLKNDASTGAKGYAAFNLSDGEHYVDVVFINKIGDVTVETRKISVDSTPADIKIEAPLNGSLFDPSVGIPIKLTTDDSTTINVYLDDKQVIKNEKVDCQKTKDGAGKDTYSTQYETTLTTLSPKYSHEVKIVATDKNGNSTEHIATVVNKRAAKLGGIKILGKAVSEGTTELTAVGLDTEGKELGIDIAKDRFKWTLLSDPSEASMFVASGNESTVVMQNDDTPFVVKAQLDVGNNQYLTDIYDSGIVGSQEPGGNGSDKPNGGSTGGSTGGGGAVFKDALPDEINDLVDKVKSEMSDSANVKAYKMYADVDSVSKQNGEVVFASGKDIKEENYLVIGTDSNTDAYANGLPDGGKFRSEIMQIETEKAIDKLLLDFKVTGIGNNANLGVYRYADSIGRWLYIGGSLDEARGMMSANSVGNGRYAVIENPKMSDIDFVDIEDSWAKLYIRSLGYAGLLDGYVEDGLRYFRPENEITRGEFVKMLAAAKGSTIDSADVSMFADSSEIADWAAPYASAAYREGWLKGDQTDRGIEARLSDRITRQDAMTLVYRVFFDGRASSGRIDFSDSSEVSEYAQAAVSFLTENNIVSGFEDGSLRPLDSLLREQIAKILWISMLK